MVSAVIPVALADASRAGFVLGVLGVLGILGIALSSRKRVLWVSRILARCAGQKAVKVAEIQKIDRATPKAPVAAASKDFADLVLALKGLGASMTEARWAAGQATSRLHDASFEQQFKFAVQAMKRTA
jgi:hypothetical protein